MARTRGFTLLELLIVIAIIAILASFTIPAVLKAKDNARKGIAHTQIANLKAALSCYMSDTGRYPRRPGPLVAGDALFKNDVAYLYAALMNNRTLALGGGPNAPYMERNRDLVAHAAVADVDNNSWMSVNPSDVLGAPWLSALPQDETDALNDASFQSTCLPGSSNELVFVDPWGNPYIYREWASVPRSMKDGLSILRTAQVRSSGPFEKHVDRPHNPDGFDIISAGPNGIFEYGGGDDICSWQVTK